MVGRQKGLISRGSSANKYGIFELTQYLFLIKRPFYINKYDYI